MIGSDRRSKGCPKLGKIVRSGLSVREIWIELGLGLISRFLSSTCTEVSGVENIGQCGRLSQLSWLLGAL